MPTSMGPRRSVDHATVQTADRGKRERTWRRTCAACIVFALAALTGCEGPTQLRVVALNQPFRAGTFEAVATTWIGDQGHPLSFQFADPTRTTASFLFQFETRSSTEFLTVVTTHFTPAVPRSNERHLHL